MTCTAACLKPRGRQCHCSVCHRTFTALRPFDMHRSRGVCLDPGTAWQMSQRDGVWGHHGTRPAYYKRGDSDAAV